MKLIEGVFTSAKVFTINNETTGIDQYAEAQLKMICDHEVAKGSTIRVMPDVHPGKIGTIGLTIFR